MFFQRNVLLDQESTDAACPRTTRTGLTSNTGRFSQLPAELFIILASFLADVDAVLLRLTYGAVAESGSSYSRHSDCECGNVERLRYHHTRRLLPYESSEHANVLSSDGNASMTRARAKFANNVTLPSCY